MHSKHTLDNMLQIDRGGLARICSQNNVAFLGVFGSFARDEADQNSDVDLLVRFNTRKSLLDLVRIEGQLSDFLGREVDLLTEAAVHPYLRERIHAETQTLYESTQR